MRIAYCIHALNLSGGTERVLTLKANYLADQFGYDVWIVTARMHGRQPFFPLSSRIHTVDLGVNDRLPFLRGRLRRALDRQLKAIRPDITVSTGGRELSILPRCTDGSVKMAEYHFSHEKFNLKYGGLYGAWRTRRLEKAAAALAAFVVLTREDQRRWKKEVPQVRQIYNPLTFQAKGPARLEERRCIAVGRLEPQKNFQDLVKAWEQVARQYPDWSLDIFGDGRQRDRLESLVRSLQLEKSIHFRGTTSSMEQELAEHSILVMSSRYEGFPMILLEAAAAGLPMVSYDCSSGPSEIIEEGVNGFLAPVGDTDALAGGICRLIGSEDLRKQMGSRAAGSVEPFRLDRIMQEWDRLFRSLL